MSRRIAGAVVLEASEGEIAWSCRVVAVALLIRSAKWQDSIKRGIPMQAKNSVVHRGAVTMVVGAAIFLIYAIVFFVGAFRASGSSLGSQQ